QDYAKLWLRMAMNVHHAGRQALLAGSGVGYPPNVVDEPDTRYFSDVARCALVCDRDALADRLRERVWVDEELVAEFLDTNDWFREHGPDHGVRLVDTTTADVAETVAEVRAWVDDVALDS
ncbi:MAG: hypothetical protein ABEJ85_00535, partial [Haloarculaceae archaeon]